MVSDYLTARIFFSCWHITQIQPSWLVESKLVHYYQGRTNHLSKRLAASDTLQGSYEPGATRVVSCHVMLSRVESCRAESCRVVSCWVVSCRVVSCRVLSSRVVSGWLKFMVSVWNILAGQTWFLPSASYLFKVRKSWEVATFLATGTLIYSVPLG